MGHVFAYIFYVLMPPTYLLLKSVQIRASFSTVIRLLYFLVLKGCSLSSSGKVAKVPMYQVFTQKVVACESDKKVVLADDLHWPVVLSSQGEPQIQPTIVPDKEDYVLYVLSAVLYKGPAATVFLKAGLTMAPLPVFSLDAYRRGQSMWHPLPLRARLLIKGQNKEQIATFGAVIDSVSHSLKTEEQEKFLCEYCSKRFAVSPFSNLKTFNTEKQIK